MCRQRAVCGPVAPFRVWVWWQGRVHTRASFVLGFFLRVFGAADIKNVEGCQPAPLLFDLVYDPPHQLLDVLNARKDRGSVSENGVLSAPVS